MYSEWLKTCSEKELFIYIYSLGEAYWSTTHDLADGRYESTPQLEQWLVETRSIIENGVDETSRFGVTRPRISSGATANYWAWYRKMKSWEETLNRESWIDWMERMPWNAKAL